MHREGHSSQTSMAPNLSACSLHHQDKSTLKTYSRFYSKNKHTLLLSSDDPCKLEEKQFYIPGKDIKLGQLEK